jgi:Ran-binding protein 1
MARTHRCAGRRCSLCVCPIRAQQAAPVFGAASSGSGGGFAGFTGTGFGAAAGDNNSAAAAAAAGGEGEDDDGAAPEEECQAEYKPVVQLDEVETSTGEEDEEALVDL